MPEPTATASRAADLLAISDRQVGRLVAAGRLKSVGKDEDRRILVSSIEQYQAERRNQPDIQPDMSFSTSVDSEQDRLMQKLIRTLPPLSAPARAARRLGISAGELEGLLNAGHVPVIAIGPNRSFRADGWRE